MNDGFSDMPARATHPPLRTDRSPGAASRPSVSAVVQRALFLAGAAALLAGCVSDSPADPAQAAFPQIERWWK